MGTMKDYREAKPPDGSPTPLRLAPRLPRNDTDPFTPSELAEARHLMRELRKILASDGCPVARSITKPYP